MAKKRYPKSEVIDNQQYVGAEAYVTWDDSIENKNAALRKSSESLEEYGIIERSAASRRYGVDFSNLDTNTSGRPGLTRADYEFFRPDESVPRKIKAIGYRAEDIYQRVGLVRNVVDLMADFAVQGIIPVHRNKRIERFYRHWFKKVNGKDRSERFLNNIYRTGNTVINRQTAKINVKVADSLYKSLASPDLYVDNLDDIKLEKREIPWRYTFIDPLCVEVSAGSLSSFVTNKRYEIILPATLRKIINSPKTLQEKEIVNQLPSLIIEAAKAKKAYPLDPSKTIVAHYKKDDWQSWAYPMIYSIMDDIFMLEKLKLADLAALDGAISNVRLWKLGSLEHKIAPTKAATAKLAQILGNNVGGGTMDIIWGPDLEFIESKTSVHQFLGEGKYIPHLNNIYAGLGIPPTLTGTFGAAGTTNNFISLKTLTQRLQYGRKILMAFWKKEIALVQKAMGFKYPAKIEFDRMDLSNEDAEKALLIQLADRNIISDELIQRVFGFDPDTEKSRLNRENRERDSDRMVKKAGPWFDPEFENSLKKISLQTGISTPSQVGLELEKKKNNEKTLLEQKVSLGPTPGSSPLGLNSTPKGVPQQGRPKNSKDTEQRKTKQFSPQTGASLNLWSLAAQDKISEILNPVLLEFYNKKNMRSLSNIQYNETEEVKAKVFLSLEPFSDIDDNYIMGLFNNINNSQIIETYSKYKNFVENMFASIKRELTSEETQFIKAYFYEMVYFSNNQ